jgi:hypothetical protein
VLRNCRISAEGAESFGVRLEYGGSGAIVEGNTVQGHEIGVLLIDQGGTHGVFQRNQMRENDYGIQSSTLLSDFGGGPFGSVGENIITCNSTNDVWVNSTTVTYLRGNSWDHVPPTDACSGGDLCDAHGTATLDVADAQLASDPCP